MSSGAEILAPPDRLGEAGPEPKDAERGLRRSSCCWSASRTCSPDAVTTPGRPPSESAADHPSPPRREGVLVASAKITGPMLATIDRGDLETTVRTLDDITRRARGIPARPTTTEDKR